MNTPRASNNQPPGTVSILSYLYEVDDDGILGAKIAVTHRYQRPDGSSMPDPKMVIDADGRKLLAVKG